MINLMSMILTDLAAWVCHSCFDLISKDKSAQSCKELRATMARRQDITAQ